MNLPISLCPSRTWRHRECVKDTSWGGIWTSAWIDLSGTTTQSMPTSWKTSTPMSMFKAQVTLEPFNLAMPNSWVLQMWQSRTSLTTICTCLENSRRVSPAAKRVEAPYHYKWETPLPRMRQCKSKQSAKVSPGYPFTPIQEAHHLRMILLPRAVAKSKMQFWRGGMTRPMETLSFLKMLWTSEMILRTSILRWWN